MKITKESLLQSGIYRIRCLLNDKVYVGSAKLFKERCANHKSSLKRKIHHSVYLQRSVDKYGVDNFIFEIIEVIKNPTKESLEQREQYWIDFYKSYLPENGYNVNRFATSCLGRKLSQETKNKISKAHIGKPTYIRTEAQIEEARKRFLGNKLGVGNKFRLGKQSWNKGITTTRFVVDCNSCGHPFKQKYKSQKTCSKSCRAILRSKIQNKSNQIDLVLFKQYIINGLSAPAIGKIFKLSQPTIKKYCREFLPELVELLKQNGIRAITISATGRYHSDETKKQISKSHQGIRHTSEVIAKIKATKLLKRIVSV